MWYWITFVKVEGIVKIIATANVTFLFAAVAHQKALAEIASVAHTAENEKLGGENVTKDRSKKGKEKNWTGKRPFLCLINALVGSTMNWLQEYCQLSPNKEMVKMFCQRILTQYQRS